MSTFDDCCDATTVVGEDGDGPVSDVMLSAEDGICGRLPAPTRKRIVCEGCPKTEKSGMVRRGTLVFPSPEGGSMVVVNAWQCVVVSGLDKRQTQLEGAMDAFGENTLLGYVLISSSPAKTQAPRRPNNA